MEMEIEELKSAALEFEAALEQLDREFIVKDRHITKKELKKFNEKLKPEQVKDTGKLKFFQMSKLSIYLTIG